MTCRGLANSGLWQAGIGQAAVSHLPVSPNRGRWLTGAWPIPAYDKPESATPRKVIFRDLVMPESHLGKPEKMIWWNQLPKVIFRGRVIPACPKPELIGIFKLTFRGLKNPGKWLKLDKVISGILKPLKMVSWSSREIVSLKIFLQTCRASRMSLVSPPSSNGWTIPLTMLAAYFRPWTGGALIL